ncbi:MAG: DUF4276 family protein [Rhodospirillales bacterium]|nr:DUF4276 family protein [Rhodospirillales bacterium]
MLSAIYPVVEGHGEVSAVPILLRRFAYEIFQNYEIRILEPYRLPKGQMVSDDRLERVVEFAARKLDPQGGRGAIVVLLDADTDCPATLGPELLARVQQARPDVPSSVNIAKHEFEAWFLAAAVSLRGASGVSQNADAPPEPENIQDAKGYLTRNIMEPEAHYSETIDQPRFTAVFDIHQARSCPSFDKLWRDLDQLFSANGV